MLLPCSRVGAASLVASLFLVISPTRLAGQDPQLILNTYLKGLTSVSVFVHPIDAEAERDGLSTSQLKTDVELRLRQSGIAVAQQAPGYLWVGVDTIKSRLDNRYSFDVQVKLYRSVVIVEIDQTAPAIIWWTPSTIAITPASDLAKHVREDLSDQIDTFANAYLSANPKK
jgi:hypothetical protein